MTDQPTSRPDVPKTFRSGPSDPIAFADGPGTYVEIDIAASPAAVWGLVTDINMPAEYSTEFKHAEWTGPDRGLGSTFLGSNENSTIGEWTLTNVVDRFEEERVFGWATVDADNPGARWWFTLEPTPTGTHLRYDVSIGPGPSGLTFVIDSMPDKEPRIISGRLREMYNSMQRTLAGIKERLEA